LDVNLVKLGLVPFYPGIADGGVQLDMKTLNEDQDILFIDSDLNVAIEAPAGQKLSLPPVIGLIGVGAPSRLKSLVRLGATATLRKPVHGGSVYSALFVGINEFRCRRALMERLEAHEKRRRGRRHLVKAIIALMRDSGCDEDQAYDRLRRDSMRRRLSLEDYCDAFVRTLPGADERDLPVQGKLRAETSK